MLAGDLALGPRHIHASVGSGRPSIAAGAPLPLGLGRQSEAEIAAEVPHCLELIAASERTAGQTLVRSAHIVESTIAVEDEVVASHVEGHARLVRARLPGLELPRGHLVGHRVLVLTVV